jgi:hypothetical protein
LILKRRQHESRIPDATDRLKYVKELIEHRVPVDAVETITLKWSSASRFRAQVLVHRGEIARKHREMLGFAQRSGLLSADEAKALPPAIDVRLNDQRRNKSTRLPEPVSFR